MFAGKRPREAFTIYRRQVRPFDQRTVQIAQIVAEQRVIAIENARRMSALRANDPALRGP